LGCRRFGGQNNSETARCFSLFPAVFADGHGGREDGDAKAGFTREGYLTRLVAFCQIGKCFFRATPEEFFANLDRPVSGTL
jgi:hypothetical protein